MSRFSGNILSRKCTNDHSTWRLGKFETSYRSTEAIKISVKNKSSKRLFVIIALEIKIKNNWEQAWSDIYKKYFYAKEENVLVLPGNETVIEKWIPESIADNGKKLNGEYRFCFKYCSHPKFDSIERIKSSDFILNQAD